MISPLSPTKPTVVIPRRCTKVRMPESSSRDGRPGQWRKSTNQTGQPHAAPNSETTVGQPWPSTRDYMTPPWTSCERPFVVRHHDAASKPTIHVVSVTWSGDTNSQRLRSGLPPSPVCLSQPKCTDVLRNKLGGEKGHPVSGSGQ